MNRKLTLNFLLLLSLQGCGGVPVINNQDDTAAYAEAVFRRQNILTSQLMMSVDEGLLSDSEVENAELAMHEACKLLNEYSNREMEGESMTVWFKHQVKASLSGCDESIGELEELLEDY
jgi:hypothetical protein